MTPHQSIWRTSLLCLAFLVVIGPALGACGADDISSADHDAEIPQTSERAEANDSSATNESGDSTTDSTTDSTDDPKTLFPDVVAVDAGQGVDGTWTFNVTLSSPYDSPERYADAWRVVGLDGTVYGERVLLHDHAGEQPFTRSQSGIEIPDDVTEVLVEGRDQVSGWGGETMTYILER